MSRVFRLQGLLRLRRLQEDQAAAALARANLERRLSQERREDLHEILAAQALPADAHSLGWQAAVAGRIAMVGLVSEATTAVEVAMARAGLAGDDWSAARTRTTTVEKLEERHDAAVLAEDLRLEQHALDEAAARRQTPEELA